jgi:hypothetical protein
MTLIDLTNVRGVAVLGGQRSLDPVALDPVAADLRAAADAGLSATGTCHAGPPAGTGEDVARG